MSVESMAFLGFILAAAAVVLAVIANVRIGVMADRRIGPAGPTGPPGPMGPRGETIGEVGAKTIAAAVHRAAQAAAQAAAKERVPGSEQIEPIIHRPEHRVSGLDGSCMDCWEESERRKERLVSSKLSPGGYSVL